MREHLCHAYDCKRPCEPRCLMCEDHWRMVPPDLARAVWAAYQPGQERGLVRPTRAWIQAANRARWAVRVAEQGQPVESEPAPLSYAEQDRLEALHQTERVSLLGRGRVGMAANGWPVTAEVRAALRRFLAEVTP